MEKQKFRYFTFLSQGQTMRRWWFSCTIVAKPLAHFRFLLYMTRILSGRERESFEEPALPLAVDEGMSTKQGGRTGLAKADSMIISLCSHRLSGSLMFKPTSYFTAVTCIVETFFIRQKPEGLNSPSNDWTRNYFLSKAYLAVCHPFCNACQTKQSAWPTQDDFFFCFLGLP